MLLELTSLLAGESTYTFYVTSRICYDSGLLAHSILLAYCTVVSCLACAQAVEVHLKTTGCTSGYVQYALFDKNTM
jgi:hypothetical protein